MEGVIRAESDSIASHSFCVTLISYLTALQLQNKFQGISCKKVLEMAVLHDLAESITGELSSGFKSWVRNRTNSENLLEEIEHEVLEILLEGIYEKEKGELAKLLVEFDKCESKESKIVRFADAVDAFAFAKVHLGKIFEKNLDSVKTKLRSGNNNDAIFLGEKLAKWLDDLCNNWDEIDMRRLSRSDSKSK
ncbi:MAG: hypothetical protein QG641_1944 [Candidatus Poribacteria bacterium]|nr:hypothetical protein [Candidatus Poribacteria bacterium]